MRELKEDYQDYMRTRKLNQWGSDYPRYQAIIEYCFNNQELEDYNRYFEIWDDEVYCNTTLTLLHQADKGLVNYLAKVEKAFLEEGGIKEKMSVAKRKSRGY